MYTVVISTYGEMYHLLDHKLTSFSKHVRRDHVNTVVTKPNKYFWMPYFVNTDDRAGYVYWVYKPGIFGYFCSLKIGCQVFRGRDCRLIVRWATGQYNPTGRKPMIPAIAW